MGENVKFLQKLLDEDHQLIVSELSLEYDLSVCTIHINLTVKLGISKLSAKWVPCLF